MKDIENSRGVEILRNFLAELTKHIHDLSEGKAEKAFEINDIATLLHVHPTHLSNTISQLTGKSPCDFFEEQLIIVAKKMLLESDRSIADIARTLTYDPSNFTKFFKSYEGITPKQFRSTISSVEYILNFSPFYYVDMVEFCSKYTA